MFINNINDWEKNVYIYVSYTNTHVEGVNETSKLSQLVIDICSFIKSAFDMPVFREVIIIWHGLLIDMLIPVQNSKNEILYFTPPQMNKSQDA